MIHREPHKTRELEAEIKNLLDQSYFLSRILRGSRFEISL